MVELIPKDLAAAELKKQGCRRVRGDRNPTGDWWETSWGWRFFLQHVGANGNDVDAEQLQQHMDDLVKQRPTCN